MFTYLRNPLTVVWALLVAVTLASWWISQGQTVVTGLNPSITTAVIAIACVKAQLVIAYFMEVRSGPRWLKYSAYGWVWGLCLLLMALYVFSL